MMKKLIKRLRSKVGETLIETMASVLVFTLASIALLSMVNTSAKINMEAKEADKAHYEQMLVAEKTEGSGTADKVEFSFTNGAKKMSVEKNVSVYQNDEEGALYSYLLK